ncbi:Crp/Fnr family transcriptional regulator [Defluviimonas sp. WL0002]|uniref:Crp/Fnr family transcriptional regulator n=1 Tax=Albidovulum marisflavi TaxID=2984159 RepID=A0ABT2ZBP6_9RHOB|nr:Crp/Fnr family transcriptional regulator [Defluviimonas sp. WL0002]MCV2868487.1 Crp/Fnr family transcriptional regulator [Defluviimonas sp. WL0002]
MTMDRKVGFALLRQCGWLAATSPEFQDAVLTRANYYTFEKGKWIYRPGDAGDGLWGIIDGGVHVVLTQGKDGPRAGVFASTGFWTGEGSLLAREPRTIGLRTTRETQMAHLPGRAFLTIAAEQPDAWRWVGLLTFFHMVGALSLREDLCIRDPEARVIASLCRMLTPHWGGPAINSGIENVEVTIDISQTELAELCNVSRSLLASLLAKLRQQGVIESGYGSITVLNPAALEQRLRDFD